jgi:hypothetical protein
MTPFLVCIVILVLAGWWARAADSRPDRAVWLRSLVHPCLAAIVDRENPPWDPTLDYGFGHGNVREAYGLPQALPGWKMRSAGADWRTNPVTQLRWMAGYVTRRYGGPCQALAFHRRHGWY